MGATIARRTVLSAGIGAAGVAALASAPPALAAAAPLTSAAGVAGPTTPVGASIAPLRSHYLGLVGQAFTASSELGIDVTLVLDAIADVAPGRDVGAEDRFNLLFTAPARFTEGIYTVAHPGAPTQRFFASPYGPDSSGNTVQALVYRAA